MDDLSKLAMPAIPLDLPPINEDIDIARLLSKRNLVMVILNSLFWIAVIIFIYTFIFTQNQKQYLFHWWNGDLEKHLFFGWKISQLNKAIKLTLWVMLLMSVFEFISVSSILKNLGYISYIIIVFMFISHNILYSIVNYSYSLSKMMFSVLVFLTGNLSFGDMIKRNYSSIIDSADNVAKRNIFVHFFIKAARKNVSNDAVKRLILSMTFIFALAEVFTS